MEHTEIIIGWQKELATVISHVRERKNLHIHGPEGSGKSALLEWVFNNWKDVDGSLIPLYCTKSATLRKILLQMAEGLLEHLKSLKDIDRHGIPGEIKNIAEIKKLDIRSLKRIVLNYVKDGGFCVLLDHLEFVTPKINSFLTVLHEKTPVITASRESWDLTDYAFKGRFEFSLYHFPKLKVENLNREDACILMMYLHGNMQTKIPGIYSQFKDIFNITRGNPAMIVKIFEKAGYPGYLYGGKLNLKLILLDCRIDTLTV